MENQNDLNELENDRNDAITDEAPAAPADDDYVPLFSGEVAEADDEQDAEEDTVEEDDATAESDDDDVDEAAEDDVTEEPEVKTASNPNKTLYTVAAILIALVVAMGAALLILNKGKTPDKETTVSDNGSAAADDDISKQFTELTGYDMNNFALDAPFDENGNWAGIDENEYITKLCEYENIPVTASEVEATEDEIHDQIDCYISQNSTTEKITDRAVADGDSVNIDYVGSIDGVEFQGGNTNGSGTTVTIGVTQYIDDFLEQLIGHKPGETFNVEVTFPDDYRNDELADQFNGKDAVFVTTINYIEETVTPEFNDEFVATNLKESNGWSTVEEARRGIAEEISKSKKLSFAQAYIVNETEYADTMPDAMKKYQIASLLKYYNDYASSYGMSLGDFLTQLYGISDLNEFVTQNESSLENSIKFDLAIQAISKRLKLNMTGDTLKEKFNANYPELDFEQFVEEYGVSYIAYATVTEEVINILANNCVISD